MEWLASPLACDDMETPGKIDAIAINEVQLLLAEKRTSLAVLRTGIAVLALPLSVVSVLIATSKYYDVLHVLHFIIPLSILNFCLVILGSYLISRSILKMRSYDKHIQQIRREYQSISALIE
ncbi:hypothetical protein [Desulfogranum japonicum]|uniref:hypothetical protein n=1 Tax=Desulfogranum japonicum TaxID=231447 RepID=UPI0004271743|nr:hypothetical protein [Desulfogranum japonicum]